MYEHVENHRPTSNTINTYKYVTFSQNTTKNTAWQKSMGQDHHCRYHLFTDYLQPVKTQMHPVFYKCSDGSYISSRYICDGL